MCVQNLDVKCFYYASQSKCLKAHEGGEGGVEWMSLVPPKACKATSGTMESQIYEKIIIKLHWYIFKEVKMLLHIMYQSSS